MINSLSGGVIADNTALTFVKVEVEGAPYWYLSPTSKIKAGDRVLVPLGNRTAQGTILRVETGTRQTAPLPLNRMREIEGIL